MSETVSGKAYEAAVKGRQEFRAAYRKALADIKSLRAQLKTAVWADSAECKMLNKENAALRAENERLRTALQGLVGAVGAMKVPQNMQDAALQVTLTIGPAFDAARAALAESSPDKPSRSGDGIASEPTQEKLLAAMRWIDTFEPETTAAAEAKFGFKLFT